MNQGHQYTIGPQFSYIKSVSYTFTALSLFVHKTGVKQQKKHIMVRDCSHKNETTAIPVQENYCLILDFARLMT